jgi:drug/metabolite transporter (DMT)-like permease
MTAYYLPVVVAVAANVLYHLAQKSINSNLNPIVALVATYLVALIACGIAYLFLPSKEGLTVGLRSIGWAPILLGVAVVGVEIGYLWAYRSGWNLSSTALLVSIAVTVALVPIGLLAFHERLTYQKIIGLVLGLASIVLLGTK